MSKKATVIIKRDGTCERFSLAKLRTCLLKVLRDAGCDSDLADPLARAIGMHLREEGSDGQPSSEYLYQCVRSVLRQTDLKDAADALALHRRIRQARRRKVRIFDPDEAACAPVRWRKGTMAAYLQTVYDLRPAIARFLAGRVEERVFDLGYKLMSRSFVNELARNEVLAWGLVFDRVVATPAAETPQDAVHRHGEDADS